MELSNDACTFRLQQFSNNYVYMHLLTVHYIISLSCDAILIFSLHFCMRKFILINCKFSDVGECRVIKKKNDLSSITFNYVLD